MTENDIKILRQIQHLVLIQEEKDNLGNGSRDDSLQTKIAELEKEISPDMLTIYRKIAKDKQIFLSPLSRGNCSACGLKVPISILQHVLAKNKPVTCRACGRILYVPEIKATGIRKEEPDPKFPLSRFSTSKLMISNLKATTKEAAIAELCEAMAKEKVITDSAKVISAAIEREGILTTAVGHGIAFPHTRGVEEGPLTFAAGISPMGIDWGGQNVNLVFFTVMPVIASPAYLKLISAIARTFEDEEQFPFVLASPDAKTLWKELNKATRVAIKDAAIGG